MATTFPKTHFPWPALWLLSANAFAAPAEHPGRSLYQKLCAECHGARGQGVEEEYDEPLTGEKSPEALPGRSIAPCRRMIWTKRLQRTPN
jgi:mono/diheme cytochrome c family protein